MYIQLPYISALGYMVHFGTTFVLMIFQYWCHLHVCQRTPSFPPFRLSAFPPFRNVSWWNSTTFPLNKCNDQTPGDSQRVSSDLARQMNNGSTWLMQATGRRRVSRIDATWSLVFITNPIGIALGILAVLRSWDNQEPGWARLCGQASLQLPNIHWSSKNTQMELSWNRATPSSHPF